MRVAEPTPLQHQRALRPGMVLTLSAGAPLVLLVGLYLMVQPSGASVVAGQRLLAGSQVLLDGARAHRPGLGEQVGGQYVVDERNRVDVGPVDDVARAVGPDIEYTSAQKPGMGEKRVGFGNHSREKNLYSQRYA